MRTVTINCEFSLPRLTANYPFTINMSDQPIIAPLLTLPFDMHILIVKYLSLKDCIAYMQACYVTHDAVQYVFSHRRELNFKSVLDDYTIASP